MNAIKATPLTRKELNSRLAELVKKERDFHREQAEREKAFRKEQAKELAVLAKEDSRTNTVKEKASNPTSPRTKQPSIVGTAINALDRHFPLTSVEKGILTSCLKGQEGRIKATSGNAEKVMECIPASCSQGDAYTLIRWKGLKKETVITFDGGYLCWEKRTIGMLPERAVA